MYLGDVLVEINDEGAGVVGLVHRQLVQIGDQGLLIARV